MKKLLVSCGVAIFVGGAAVAADYSAKGLGFIAPQVTDKGSVSSPHLGEIIFDTGVSKFFGRDSGSTWIELSSGVGNVVPIGTILPFAGTTAPTGYHLCDGTPLSRTTYSDLYAVIGDAFGNGDGSNSFNVPDLRGRFIRGVDGSAGVDPDASTRTAMASGGNVGDNVGSIQADAFKSHTHSFVLGGDGFAAGTVAQRTTNNLATGGTNATGGNETRPVNAYLNYIIKL